jgi:hypothetical protein
MKPAGPAPWCTNSQWAGFVIQSNIKELPMKETWFKRFGWFHLPASIPGAVVFFAAIVFCVNVFLAIDRHSHSVSDTLYGVFPFFACTFLLLDWIARSSSRS